MSKKFLTLLVISIALIGIGTVSASSADVNHFNLKASVVNNDAPINVPLNGPFSLPIDVIGTDSLMNGPFHVSLSGFSGLPIAVGADDSFGGPFSIPTIDAGYPFNILF